MVERWSAMGRTIRGPLVAALVASSAACAGLLPASEPALTPVVAPPELRALRVYLPDQASLTDPLEREVTSAVAAALLRAGVGVVADRRIAHDVDARLSLSASSAGVVVEGAASLVVEREGILVDQIALPRDVYRGDRFAEVVAGKLADALVRSPQLLAFARAPGPRIVGPAPAVVASAPVAPVAAPAVVAAAPVAPVAAPAGPAPLGRAGAFGKGLNLELIAVGAVQAFSAGGAEGGIGLATILQVDTGPRWAFRLPIAIDVTSGSERGGFADISLTPGVLHRWRHAADQKWIPYVGGGVKLGSFGAGHELLGQPVVTTAALEIGDHHFHSTGGSHDPNFEVRLRAAPELWGGFEYHTSSWFSLDLGATYAWIRIAGENVHLVREMLGIRFSF
jgi:hypothetical protein